MDDNYDDKINSYKKNHSKYKVIAEYSPQLTKTTQRNNIIGITFGRIFPPDER